MKVNCDYERTLKVSIIALIQLIGGITLIILLESLWSGYYFDP